MHPLTEQTILVTGATDGLGKALVTRLAATGASVVLHGRDDGRGHAALGEIRAATGNDRLSWERADLASLGEVRELAARVADRHPRLDALVNNAGIGASIPPGGHATTADGIELRFAVNYLAGFYLTWLLLPVLRASAPARIVMVSSAGQQAIDFDDVMLTRGYTGVRAYCQSKLAQIVMAFDLAEELAGRGVTINALHPATYMPTKIVPTPMSPLEEGAQATFRLVADPDLDGVSGRYFDRTREARADPQAYEPAARARLRRLSERLTGLDRAPPAPAASG
jgi:NAD(P)-dependent dehydrogenase (short-subunit alcohol dehydrogenase family)